MCSDCHICRQATLIHVYTQPHYTHPRVHATTHARMNSHQVLSGVYYPPEAYDGTSRRFEGTGDNGWECGLYPDATGLDGYTYLMSSNSYEDWNNFDQFSADVTLYADQPRAFQCAVAEMDGGDHIRIRCDSFHAVVSVCLSLFCLSYMAVCESVCCVLMRTRARPFISYTNGKYY